MFPKLCFYCHNFMVARVKSLMNPVFWKNVLDVSSSLTNLPELLKKGKKYVSFPWIILLITAPIGCLDETKKKSIGGMQPHLILLRERNEISYCVYSYDNMLACSKHNWSSLLVSYLPQYLRPGKTFKYHHLVLFGFLVGIVFTTTVYI